MKIPAVVLAVVLSAASIWAQALVGYAGATASSGTAAAGSASKLTDSGMGAVQRKLSAAMGEPTAVGRMNSSTHGTKTEVHVRSARADSGMHSGMHCGEMKSSAHAALGKQCKEVRGAKTGGAPEKTESGANQAAAATGKNDMKITFVGAK